MYLSSQSRCSNPRCMRHEADDPTHPFACCGHCNVVKYCSRPCQRRAWRDHRRWCIGGMDDFQAGGHEVDLGVDDLPRGSIHDIDEHDFEVVD